MKVAAARAIAGSITDDELSEEYIVPSILTSKSPPRRPRCRSRRSRQRRGAPQARLTSCSARTWRISRPALARRAAEQVSDGLGGLFDGDVEVFVVGNDGLMHQLQLQRCARARAV